MDGERSVRLQRLFDLAVELPSGERDAFVRAACADDPVLRDELLRLLDGDAAADTLFGARGLAGLHAALQAAVPAIIDRGRKIGPFTIVELLGHGGMGRVYRAVRTADDVEQEVAIKLVLRERVDERVLRRFSAERQLLARLSHPGICRFHDAGMLEDGTPYVVMEYIRGEPLLAWCDRRGLSIEARLALFRKVLGAVIHAHRNLVVHRDIKSNNILVDEHGEPRLLDFGIARPLSAEGSTDRTATADRFFTPGSAAPEQLLGEPVAVTCDVYALGTLLFELLSGSPPFDFTDLRAAEIERLLLDVAAPPLGRRIADGAAAARGLSSPDALRRRLAGDLDAVVQQCLRKRPHERYGDVQQLDDEIERILLRRPIAVRGSARWYRLRCFVQRHRLASALTGVLAVTVIAAIALLSWQAYALAEQRNLALIERDHSLELANVLRDAFSAADPARVSGGEVTARHVLDAAKSRIGTLQERQPQLYASLAASLAEVELDLALDSSAAQLAERGIAAARRGDVDPGLLRRLLMLHARATVGTSDFEAAERALDEVSGIDDGEQADWLVVRGRLLDAQAREPDAVPVLERAVALLSAQPPTDRLATSARWALADALRGDDRPEESLRVIDATIAWQRQGLPADHARLILSRLRRTNVIDAKSAVAEAERVVADVVRLYGEGSSMSAYAETVHAAKLHEAGDTDAAIRASTAALQAFDAALGRTHPNTILARYNLAVAQAARPDRAAEAERLYTDALDDAERRFGTATRGAALIRIGYIELLLRRSRSVDALRMLHGESGLAGYAVVTGDVQQRYRQAWRQAYESCSRTARTAKDCVAPSAAVVAYSQAP